MPYLAGLYSSKSKRNLGLYMQLLREEVVDQLYEDLMKAGSFCIKNNRASTAVINDRNATTRTLFADEVSVMVATSAFGMGIDEIEYSLRYPLSASKKYGKLLPRSRTCAQWP